MKLSFVIPCYGSEGTIATVTRELTETLRARKECDYEIILVSDSSPDEVYCVIKDLAEENPRVKGIQFAKNFGQHAALMAGYEVTDGDIIVSLDDDGETPAKEIFKLIDRLDDNTDVVLACFPMIKRSWFRRWGSAVNALMARLLIGLPKNIQANSSLVAYKRYVIDEMLRYKNPYPYIGGLIFRTTLRVVNVEIEYHTRLAGKSGYSIRKLISLWMNGFTAFSIKPLRIATFTGCLCAFSGFCWTVYIVINRLLNEEVALGYASTMAVMLFIGGVLMLMLGIIGEYIGRIYICLNKAPQYVIRHKTF